MSPKSQTRNLLTEHMVLPLLVVMFNLSFQTFAQPAPRKVVITLYVNTAQITSNNMPANCNFGQPSGVTNENFTTVLNVGDSITWMGVSSNAPGSDIVNITSINYRGGTNVFGQNTLRGNGKSPEMVKGKAIVATGGNNCKYAVSFTVLNNGVRRNGTFVIDPKLEVH